LRRTGAAELGPFSSATKELAPLEVRAFRWWEDELASIKAAEAEKEVVAAVDEEEEEEASGNGRAPKKRSITDLFAEAPSVGAGSELDAVVDEEEVLRSIVRRSKELRRKRRLEQAASAAAADEPETLAAGERRAAEGNFPRKVRGPAQPDPTRPTPCLQACSIMIWSSSCSNVFILSCLFTAIIFC
jgi:hypothetical protein